MLWRWYVMRQVSTIPNSTIVWDTPGQYRTSNSTIVWDTLGSLPDIAERDCTCDTMSIAHIIQHAPCQYRTLHTIRYVSTGHRTPHSVSTKLYRPSAMSVPDLTHHTLSQYRTLSTICYASTGLDAPGAGCTLPPPRTDPSCPPNTPKLNTRSRKFSTICTRNAVPCPGFRGVRSASPPHVTRTSTARRGGVFKVSMRSVRTGHRTQCGLLSLIPWQRESGTYSSATRCEADRVSPIDFCDAFRPSSAWQYRSGQYQTRLLQHWAARSTCNQHDARLRLASDETQRSLDVLFPEIDAVNRDEKVSDAHVGAEQRALPELKIRQTSRAK
eukprot:3656932-Rhodomonas_salina.3